MNMQRWAHTKLKYLDYGSRKRKRTRLTKIREMSLKSIENVMPAIERSGGKGSFVRNGTIQGSKKEFSTFPRKEFHSSAHVLRVESRYFSII